jgi:hypothetical protein
MVSNSLQVTTQKSTNSYDVGNPGRGLGHPSVAWLDKLVNGNSNRYKQTIQTCTDSLPLKKSTYYHKHKWQHEHVVIFPSCMYFNIMLVSRTVREDQSLLHHLY